MQPMATHTLLLVRTRTFVDKYYPDTPKGLDDATKYFVEMVSDFHATSPDWSYGACHWLLRVGVDREEETIYVDENWATHELNPDNQKEDEVKDDERPDEEQLRSYFYDRTRPMMELQGYDRSRPAQSWGESYDEGTFDMSYDRSRPVPIDIDEDRDMA